MTDEPYLRRPRERLPNRRVSVTHKLNLAGMTFHLDIGFDALGRPKEVFLSGGLEGSDGQTHVQHVAILVSIALQHGADPVKARASLATPAPDAGWIAQLLPQVFDRVIAEMPNPDALALGGWREGGA